MSIKTPRLIRDRCGVYYFRLIVPLALRQSVGKTEFRRSLRTKDSAIARQRALALSVAVETRMNDDIGNFSHLQTGYGEALAPLGIRRGEPGSQAVHSEVRQFYGAVNAAKNLPERVKLPPAPKAPAPPSGVAVEVSNALGAAFGFETPHQRAMKAHAEAMKQWRETCKELRQQDAKAWEQLKVHSALAPLALRRHSTARTLAASIQPKVKPKNMRSSISSGPK